jgi:prepilin-type N-terminal cleavage/methylation domain-containing protein
MNAMNTIIKRQLKGKKGFTLIEVIVVLVILAILAAVAIPALTGYIDEANDRAAISEGHTILVGLQAIVTASYGDTGKINGYTAPYFALEAGKTTDNAISEAKLTTDGATKVAKLTGIHDGGTSTTNGDFTTSNPTGVKVSGDKVVTNFVWTTAAGKTLTYDVTAASKWVVS